VNRQLTLFFCFAPLQALALNNIAVCLDDQGRAAEALAMYQEALSIKKKHLGADHPDVAAATNNIAVVLKRQGRLEEARVMFEAALTVYRKALGRGHLDVAGGGTNGIVKSLQEQSQLIRDAHMRRCIGLITQQDPAAPSTWNAR
jgi:tetratricopeptide (TPR) repeat protein